MAKNNFYSTYARYIIGKWVTLVALIRTYALDKSTPLDKNLELAMPTMEQIREAIYSAPDLVIISFDMAGAFQKAQRIVNKKSDLIEQQIQLVSDILVKALNNQNVPPPIPIPELEKQLSFLQEQKKVLDGLIQQINAMEPNIDAMIKQYENAWDDTQKLYANKAITELEGALKIQFSELEKNELLKPTQTQNELLTALKKYQLNSLVK